MKFVAFPRELQGTGASRRLRIAGKVPGIVYGGETKPQMIELDHNALFHALRKEAFHSSLLDMELGGSSRKVLLRNVQMHAFKPLVLHIDFQRVDAKTRIVKKVPLHFINEENSPAVKIDKCLINHVASELEIEVLAEKLPEFLTIDLAEMTKGHSLHASNIKFPAGIKVLTHGKKDPVLATVVAQEEEVIADPAAVAAAAATAAPEKGKGKAKPKK